MNPKFKIGDEVVVGKGYESPSFIGLQGFVKCFDGSHIGVEFDIEDKKNAKVLSELHDLRGFIKIRAGRFFRDVDLSLVKSDKKEKKSFLSKTEIKKMDRPSLRKYIHSLLTKDIEKERKKYINAYTNCVLNDNIKEMIEESIISVIKKDQYNEWLGDNFEKGITNSILLYGKPGTGKTMIAEAIAGVLGRDLLKLDGGDLQSNIPGQMERNIKANFEKARELEAVILLDECDSLLYNRDSVGSVIAAEINVLLTEIENFDGVIIMTTNRIRKLDPALARRIIAKIEVPTPNLEARKQIWRNLIPKTMPIDKKLDIDYIAEPELTGGEIKNAILMASRKALISNEPCVNQEHFVRAIEAVLATKDDFNQEEGVIVHGFDKAVHRS